MSLSAKITAIFEQLDAYEPKLSADRDPLCRHMAVLHREVKAEVLAAIAEHAKSAEGEETTIFSTSRFNGIQLSQTELNALSLAFDDWAQKQIGQIEPLDVVITHSIRERPQP